MTTKKAVLTLNGKFYHAYDANEIEEAQKRARKLADAGKQVTLKWMSTEQTNELEQAVASQLKEIKSAESQLKQIKKEMADDLYTWNGVNNGTIRKCNKLESNLKNLKAAV